MWWPCKDQWKDEVENMDISVAAPNGLTDVSNGRFVVKIDLGDGYSAGTGTCRIPSMLTEFHSTLATTSISTISWAT